MVIAECNILWRSPQAFLQGGASHFQVRGEEPNLQGVWHVTGFVPLFVEQIGTL